MKGPGTGQPTPRDASDGAASLRREASACQAQARKILWEGVIVALTGALFAFAANEVSPRGLALARNYFPGAARSPLPTATATQLTLGTGDTNIAVPSPAKLLAARLQAKGLYLVESNQVAQLFSDPRYEQELIVFIDARDDRHYQEGHIPGAYQLDHYRAENYLATVLPVCQAAEQIMVYCTGGECEDSEFTAIFLRDAGIPKEKLFVYGGGMTEWTTNGLPVEIGGHKSGNFRPVKP
jgi:rhodanese-related sulfurtransferase